MSAVRNKPREDSMRLACLAVAAFAATLGSLPAMSSSAMAAGGVDKLYVLDCGTANAPDQSRWSPGVTVGVPLPASDNCYCIHHAQDWFLWDSGINDAVAAMPDGLKGENGAPSWTRKKTLAPQLDHLGVKTHTIKGIWIFR